MSFSCLFIFCIYNLQNDASIIGFDEFLTEIKHTDKRHNSQIKY